MFSVVPLLLPVLPLLPVLALDAGQVAAAADLRSGFLEAHNRERLAVGVAPLRWSATLEADARRWAEQLARWNRLQHAPLGSQGENLWMAPARGFHPLEAIRAFASEKAVFRNQPMPQISRTGRWQDAGHYSQMVWARTTTVGCASSRNTTHQFVVCRYAPPGNVISQKAF
jgi:hypothetical protein